MILYPNRIEAGRALAHAIETRVGRNAVVVLAVSRGGVPVALEVALALDAPLDVLLVRPLVLPARAEIIIGAIASGDVYVLNEERVARWAVNPSEITAAVLREGAELHRREINYRRGRPPADLHNRMSVLIDDGIVSTMTMRTAITAARRLGASEVLAAAPVGVPETCAALQLDADRLICPVQPSRLSVVSEGYLDFRTVTEDDVRACLDRAAARSGSISELRRVDLLAE